MKTNALFAVALLTCSFMSIANLFSADEHVWLHVDGKYIKKSPVCSDPNGIWMGCGVACRKNIGMTENSALLQSKVDWLVAKSSYVNLTRISVNNIEDFPGAEVYVSSFLAPLVNMLKAKKIYSIIDSHYYMRDDITWFGPFWDVVAPSTWCVRWIDDWAYVANYFKDEPWVAGYELCNEPIYNYPSSQPQGTIAKARNNYKECIKRIRQSDTKHILFIGNARWSSGLNIKNTWEIGLAATEQYKPDPGYNQVVFTFHEYTKCGELYASAGGQVNNELGRIQNTFNVPVMCTEFGQDETCAHGLPVSEKRRFEQEMTEMCYGEPNFWQGVTAVPDPAYPSRGIPAISKTGWILWRLGSTPAQFETTSNWSDIWAYAAERQASRAPEPITDPTPPSDIATVRDGTGADTDSTPLTTELSANWTSSADADSGISRYWYAIGTTAGATDIVNWTSNSSATNVTRTGLTLANGQKYYFSVKAQNGSLLYSNVTNSNGQTVIVSAGSNPNFYPNPYKPSTAIPAKFKLKTPGGGEVNIYTISGRLIKKLPALPVADMISWDGTNEAAERVKPGIYIYTITQTSGDKTSGKLAVTK